MARVDITYDILTEESVSEGDAAERGYVEPTYDSQVNDRPAESWRLSDAVRYLLQNSESAESCWAPDDNRLSMSTEDNQQTMSIYGCAPREYPGDYSNPDYCLHVKDMSRGSLMRLAKVLASNGVYFANVPSLRRSR